MLRLLIIPVAVALLLPPGIAQAQCPQDSIRGALAARLDRSALPILKQVLINDLPSVVSIPETPFTLMTCPQGFDNTVVTPRAGEIDIAVKSLDIRLLDGAVEVDGEVDIDATSMLEMQLCAMPNATCPATLSAQGLKLKARLEPSVTDCRPSLPLTVAEVSINQDSATVQLDSCGLYDEIFTLVYAWYRDTLLTTVTDEIERALREEVPALVEETVTGLIADGVDVYGLHFDAAVESIKVSSEAIVVRFTANATPSAGVAACLPPGASLPEEVVTRSAPIPYGNAMLGVSLSQSFLQRGVRAAWLAGWLCFDTRTFGLDLSEVLAPLAPGATLDATLVVTEPPAIDLSAPQNNNIQVSASALSANLSISAPNSPATHVLAELGATLGGRMLLDDAAQALTVEVTDVGSSGLVMQAGNDAELLFSQATLESVLQNFLLPAFAEGVGPLPLTSGLFMAAPVAVRLDGVDVDTYSVQANLDLWPIDKNDRTAPQTILLELPTNPAKASLTLKVGSLDDTTPQKFMRHTIAIDGVLSDVPTSGDTLLVSGLKGGLRYVAIMAVDLNDNVDPTPIEMALMIDDAPPVVTITEAPSGLTADVESVVNFVALDNLTKPGALAARFEVSKLMPQGAKDELLFAGELGLVRKLVLKDLPENEIVRVTIFVKDEAGNEGISSVSFAVDTQPTLNCASARPGSLSVLFALFVTVNLCRRRRHRS